ncbi:MAG: metallophosphoesterase [bacterium]|nr:MAG: metallophosphoesterase [bacterium]
MKNHSFLIFFSIVLFIYAVINFYIFRRGWLALQDAGIYRTIYLYLFIFLMLCYPLGRLVEQLFRNSFTDFLVIIGSFYLGIMVYALLAVLLIDLLRLSNHFFSFLPSFITANPQRSAQISALVVTVSMILIVIGGHINALFPRTRIIELNIPKKANGIKELNAVMMSDIHLGTIIRSQYLDIVVNKINALQPDIVFLAGDIVDEDVAPVAEQNMARNFQNIQSKYGVYSITGNHEYFSGVEAAVSYMEQANVKVLQDSAVKIADAFYVIGRKDLMAERMGDGRMSLEEILQEIDTSYPLILMDHQPYHLDIAERNGIDLQISGHTHHGQLFPFNYITRMVYELSWGYTLRGNTHYYVSCGIGTWGPPIRTNSAPEIVNFKIRFQPDSH